MENNNTKKLYSLLRSMPNTGCTKVGWTEFEESAEYKIDRELQLLYKDEVDPVIKGMFLAIGGLFFHMSNNGESWGDIRRAMWAIYDTFGIIDCYITID